MTVEIVIEDERWQDADPETLAVNAAGAVYDRLNMTPADYEICILCCDDGRISALNADFRAKPSPTNVLSWPSEDRSNPGKMPTTARPGELGDIAIAYETCAKEAHDQNKPVATHISHLLVHGILHLLGFDHETDADAALMEKLEVEILETLGIADPY